MNDCSNDQDAPDNCADVGDENNPFLPGLNRLDAACQDARQKALREGKELPECGGTMIEGLVLNQVMYGRAVAEFDLRPERVRRQLKASKKDASVYIVVALINRRKPPKSWKLAAESAQKTRLPFSQVRDQLHALLRELSEGEAPSPGSQEFWKAIISAEIEQGLEWRDDRLQIVRQRALQIDQPGGTRCLLIPWEYVFILKMVGYWRRTREQLPFGMCPHPRCKHPAFIRTWGQQYCPHHQSPEEKQRRYRQRKGGH